MKNILGLDLGTNSIGWALIQKQESKSVGKIIASGSRIIPISQDVLGNFDKGVTVSQTAERTRLRGIRRLIERRNLRRERLHRVLNILGFLPEHYATAIDFTVHAGKFLANTEPKITYCPKGVSKKAEFIFRQSFEEMLKEFNELHPTLLYNGKKLPYDWTIYYLRKKSLISRIEKEELAWILLNFNQKRGYYQLRGEDEEEHPNKLIELHSLEVIAVTADEKQKGKDEIWYNVTLSNSWVYRRTSKTPIIDWLGKFKEFIVTTELNDDKSIKTDKDGKEKRTFKNVDSKEDWIAIKKSTEESLERSEGTVGEYIYNTLLHKPSQKIRGDLISVIERRFYKKELQAILAFQKKFHPELNDRALLVECLEELYEHNEGHRKQSLEKDFCSLFIDDIIFYQRPLKSKVSQISNCKFESRVYIQEGVKKHEPLKCIPKSHPLYQEFRLWQWIQNLRLYRKDQRADIDITKDLLKSESDIANLFEWLNSKKEIDQKSLLKYPHFNLKKDFVNFRWNYIEDKIYPCNETRSIIIAGLKKTEKVPSLFLSSGNEIALWHILYSVSDKLEIQKSLLTFATKKELSLDFVEHFKKTKPFNKEYGAYSEKAIKKLIPLMRVGKFWNVDDVGPNLKYYRENIEKIVAVLLAKKSELPDDRGNYSDSLNLNLLGKLEFLKGSDAYSFTGLEHFLTSYLVYGRHSEAGNSQKWRTPEKIELLPQHSMRNPIVEQIINETLKVVRDLWIQKGSSEENFFDEIHIELSREMKNPAEKRIQMTKQNTENENTNLRIKELLIELSKDTAFESVRSYSPMQQEILKLYEEGALNAERENLPDYVTETIKAKQPTQSQISRYKLWLEQKYRSPYTGAIIPLTKLFTSLYQIEHIIPRKRFFDDSFTNKVICESQVNKEKDALLGLEFIKERGGEIIELGQGKQVRIFTESEYNQFVIGNYKNSYGKKTRLLMEDIPEEFIQRQLNDSRYISKVVKDLMSNIVRDDDENEVISKHVIVSKGAITSKLKQDWGLNDIWNDIVADRFIRLNTITTSDDFGSWVNKKGKNIFQTSVPLGNQRGFSKKRIDHRHHALDAIIIACTSRSHVNFLNNMSASGPDSSIEKITQRAVLQNKLCFKLIGDTKANYTWTFIKPWETFSQDARMEIEKMVCSFKKDIRVIKKTVNYYQTWKPDITGKLTKQIVKQTKGDNWAITKSLHQASTSGQVSLQLKKSVSLAAAIDSYQQITNRELKKDIGELKKQGVEKKDILKMFKAGIAKWNGIDLSKIEIFYWNHEYTASRVELDESFNSAKVAKITDTGIQKILQKHLEKYTETGKNSIEHPELAFSSDGLETMNKNILELNQGKAHQPIYVVRLCEPMGNKFAVGTTGSKMKKFTEAAKGTNLFFGIYVNAEGKRFFQSIPLNLVIERQKIGLSSVPEIDESGNTLLFYLNPNDLVYIPTEEEREHFNITKWTELDKEKVSHIYKIVSFTGTRLYAVPCNVSSLIVEKLEFSIVNKLEFTLDKVSIKNWCMKLNVDRLGTITI